MDHENNYISQVIRNIINPLKPLYIEALEVISIASLPSEYCTEIAQKTLHLSEIQYKIYMLVN